MVLLQRFATYFGEKYVIERLQQKREVMTMFSGVECARAAWDCIHKAAEQLWQIQTGVRFICGVPCLRFSNFAGMSIQI